jgi:hypothetical protein
MSINIDKLASRMRRLQAKRAANENVTPRAVLKREPSLNERGQCYHASGYYRFYCIHERHRFTPCRACGRSQRDADTLRSNFVATCVSDEL